MNMRHALLLLLATPLAAQTLIPPTIPATLAAKTYKAQRDVANAKVQQIQADAVVEKAGQVMQGVLTELQKACGEKFQPFIDAQGDVACQAKPEPKK